MKKVFNVFIVTLFFLSLLMIIHGGFHSLGYEIISGIIVLIISMTGGYGCAYEKEIRKKMDELENQLNYYIEKSKKK